MHRVCYTTTLSGAQAMCLALAALGRETIYCLQDLHRELA